MDGVLRRMKFEDVVANVVVEIDGVRCWLNHYPIAEGDDDRDHRAAVISFDPKHPASTISRSPDTSTKSGRYGTAA